MKIRNVESHLELRKRNPWSSKLPGINIICIPTRRNQESECGCVCEREGTIEGRMLLTRGVSNGAGRTYPNSGGSGKFWSRPTRTEITSRSIRS